MEFFKKLIGINRTKSAIEKEVENVGMNIEGGYGGELYTRQFNNSQWYQNSLALYTIVKRIMDYCTRVNFYIEEKKGDNWEKVENTLLEKHLRNPNATQTFNDFINDCVAYSKLSGNVFIYQPYPFPKQTENINMFVLPTEHVVIKTKGYRLPPYGYEVNNYFQTLLAPSSVIHIKDFSVSGNNTSSQILGTNPTSVLTSHLELYNIILYKEANSRNKSFPAGVLSPQGEAEISRVTLLKLKEHLKMMQGINDNKNLLVTEAPVKFQHFDSNTLEKSNFAEVSDYVLKQICNFTGFPIQLLNNTDASTFNNVREANKAVWQTAIIPVLKTIEEHLNKYLCASYGNYRMRFDYSKIEELKVNIKELSDSVTNLSRVMTVREIRKLFQLDDTGDAEQDKLLDKIFVNMGTTTITNAVKEFEDPYNDPDDKNK